MGVHGLWELLAPVGRRVSVEALGSKKLAIDASIWIIQFMKAMRDDRGDMIRNAHLLGFFRRICKLLYLRVKPVFVFDGGTPALKRRTVLARRRQREKAQSKIRKTAEKLLLNRLRMRQLEEQLGSGETLERGKSFGGDGGDERDDEVARHDTEEVHAQPPAPTKEERENAGPASAQAPASQEQMDEILAASLSLAPEETDDGVVELNANSDEDEEETDELLMLPTAHGRLDPAVLASLPPSMQLDLLVQMREQLVAENRQKFQRVAQAPSSFSELQIEAYLKTVAFRREINEVQQAAAGVGVGGVPSTRIASETAREYIFSSAFSGQKDGLDLSQGSAPTMEAALLSVSNSQNIILASASGAVPSRRASLKDSETTSSDAANLIGRNVRRLGPISLSLAGASTFNRLVGRDKSPDRSGQGYVGNGVEPPSTGARGLQVSFANDETAGLDEGDELFIDLFSTESDFMNSMKGQGVEKKPSEDDVRVGSDNPPSGLGSFQISFLDDNSAGPDEADDFFNDLVSAVNPVNGQGKLPKDMVSGHNEIFQTHVPEAAADSELEWEDSRASPLSTCQQHQNDGKTNTSSSSDLQRKEVGLFPPMNLMEGVTVAGVDSLATTYLHVPGDEQVSLHGEGSADTTSVVDMKLNIPAAGLTNETDDDLEWEEEVEEPKAGGSCVSGQDHADDIQPTADTSLMDNEVAGAGVYEDNGPDEEQVSSREMGSADAASVVDMDLKVPDAGIADRTDPDIEWEGEEEEPVAGDHSGPCQGYGDDVRPTVGRSLLENEVVGAGHKGLKQSNGNGEDDLLRIFDGTTNVADAPLLPSSSRGMGDSGEGIPGKPDTPAGKNVQVRKASSQLESHASASPMLEISSSQRMDRPSEVVEFSQRDTNHFQAIDSQDTCSTRDGSCWEKGKQVMTDTDEMHANDVAIQEREKRKLEIERETLLREESELLFSQQMNERNADNVTGEMFAECQELLQMFGLPYIIAPMEAEAQCAFMDTSGLVDGVVTDDSDVFLFGGRNVYKNIFDDRKYVETYHMKDVESELGLSRDKLIQMALLLGSDYTEGISGIGIVNAIEVVNAFPGESGLQLFKEWLDSPDLSLLKQMPQKYKSGRKGQADAGCTPVEGQDAYLDQGESSLSARQQQFMSKHRAVSKNWTVSESFPSEAVVAAYTEPQVDQSQESFSWGRPDLDALRKMCAERFSWNKAKSDELLLPVLREYDRRETQLRLDAFYSFSQRFAKIRSTRIQKAVRGITGKLSDEIVDLPSSQISPRKKRKAKKETTPKVSKKGKTTPQKDLELGAGAGSDRVLRSSRRGQRPAGDAISHESAAVLVDKAVEEEAATSALDQAAGHSAMDQASGNTAVDQAAGNSAVDQAAGNSAMDQAAGNSAMDQAAGNSATDQAVGNSATDQAAGNSVIGQPVGTDERNAAILSVDQTTSDPRRTAEPGSASLEDWDNEPVTDPGLKAVRNLRRKRRSGLST